MPTMGIPPDKGYVNAGARVPVKKYNITRPRPAAEADWTYREDRLHESATGRFEANAFRSDEIFSISPGG